MIIINAKLQIDENKRDDYLELMNELVQNSRQEEGNVFYHHYEDVNEKNVFVVVENYKDEHAVQAHNDSGHFQTFSQHIGDYVIKEPEINVSETIEK
ncbi:putative quinol monooxygenase [Staphylococcus caprae]|uniref:Signal transduction protein TRAP n=1 Tax=Staphylococcus caprae TaxID=29380 RepID=A0ABM7FR07_9STAP|nr:putative quinol monooxygenase [Staphylococcus caprae]EES41678.1 antibiotic biosynthesis monooxygenase [Staphylococcus caprae M23864:W1]MBN6826252.1 antibiotic biosynthesis monooxygenase [Staphylococcus caprae]MBX5317426.1 antibiotic biosynthesis monooxygenase [Staphylococcus caprae]MBX5323548.1 antibiotic biosynthesis monooxygenase [Staphylococcus caprae]MDI0014482.1 putative quinol monooxygenase [Staphylococcus caprae]